jgi:signal recognition particle subunit SRP68
MEEKMEVDPVSPKFDTFYLLKSITENQQKHGLRHYDYKRYADYCNRRMRRLRKMLKFTNQHKCVPRRKAKFQPKKVTPEVVTNLK